MSKPLTGNVDATESLVIQHWFRRFADDLQHPMRQRFTELINWLSWFDESQPDVIRQIVAELSKEDGLVKPGWQDCHRPIPGSALISGESRGGFAMRVDPSRRLVAFAAEGAGDFDPEPRRPTEFSGPGGSRLIEVRCEDFKPLGGYEHPCETTAIDPFPS